ncbi:Uu.00g054670.m01.CDS01 [Anthostomella pinea]|uniref:Uu.00g054670.m01.CDS01 n=1 Tax=Anthostomella pinea TaxID=933095 RepID=A0AAI8YM92_9PEZI|nr:Uu.00g054670.m01.CDS01 [Anthostomella pinea]
MPRQTIKKIAVIGEGASGIAVARRLIAEGLEVTVYERKDQAGGVWMLTADADDAYVSPMYENLETNFPRTLMDDGLPVQYNKEVIGLYYQDKGNWYDWKIKINDVQLGKDQYDDVDAIVSAVGTFEKPFEPAYPGLDRWHQMYPETVSHARSYRTAEEFSGKRVLVGNSASGWDISHQLAEVASKVWVSSARTNARSHHKIEAVGEIESLSPTKRKVRFVHGIVARDVDYIVLCTGYQYSLPFARKSKKARGPIWPDGFRLDNLYEHMFWTVEPTLILVGVPKGGPTILIAQAQSALIARYLACRWFVPTKVDMRRWADQDQGQWTA